MDTTFLFILLTLLALLLFYLGTGRDKRVLIASLLWLTLIGGLSISGFFENTSSMPPRFLLVLLGNTGLIIAGYKALGADPLHTRLLLLVHGLRLPVEMGLYQLFRQQQIPEIMTFKGWNYDILIGISALMLFAFLSFAKRGLSKRFLIAWNIAGVLSLLTIVVIAVLSAPLPIQRLAFGQPNVAVLKFPFVFLPAYIVPVVLLTHMLALRKLVREVPPETI